MNLHWSGRVATEYDRDGGRDEVRGTGSGTEDPYLKDHIITGFGNRVLDERPFRSDSIKDYKLKPMSKM